MYHIPTRLLVNLAVTLTLCSQPSKTAAISTTIHKMTNAYHTKPCHSTHESKIRSNSITPTSMRLEQQLQHYHSFTYKGSRVLSCETAKQYSTSTSRISSTVSATQLNSPTCWVTPKHLNHYLHTRGHASVPPIPTSRPNLQVRPRPKHQEQQRSNPQEEQKPECNRESGLSDEALGWHILFAAIFACSPTLVLWWSWTYEESDEESERESQTLVGWIAEILLLYQFYPFDIVRTIHDGEIRLIQWKKLVSCLSGPQTTQTPAIKSPRNSDDQRSVAKATS